MFWKGSIVQILHNLIPRDNWSPLFCAESKLNEFEPRLKSAENRFQLSASLNLETLNTIISGTNHIWVTSQIWAAALLKLDLLTLFLLGGGSIWPPPCSFFYITQSIGLRLLKFSDFSYVPKALPLGLKPGFNTNCLSPQAHCLNDCFCL